MTSLGINYIANKTDYFPILLFYCILIKTLVSGRDFKNKIPVSLSSYS